VHLRRCRLTGVVTGSQAPAVQSSVSQVPAVAVTAAPAMSAWRLELRSRGRVTVATVTSPPWAAIHRTARERSLPWIASLMVFLHSD